MTRDATRLTAAVARRAAATMRLHAQAAAFVALSALANTSDSTTPTPRDGLHGLVYNRPVQSRDLSRLAYIMLRAL